MIHSSYAQLSDIAARSYKDERITAKGAISQEITGYMRLKARHVKYL